MIDKVVTEMKSKPFTMLMIVGLYAVVGLLWVGRADYAMAGDMATLKAEFANMRAESKRSSLETQLRQISTDLFNLKQQVSDIRAKGRYPDQLYMTRMSELENDKARLERELAALK